ncbi:PQQ-dependent sugar dehydrogenase [Aequorivita antarctica]|uniref:T9SS type A sorting domain-containing protein n=1 Tax=Aequorivita antarctica TaxID=153266 RepID=A0A5C6YWU3_9FLAO|nr:PQQ-dependent sugar dehydrogenase [Aequorivita antarctica]TXD71505.1 T9SS type A sorting domain-containing protein [Aequorivita antarctica]SRX76060.1 Aldose sugar dehydrogenase YliI [Aequorivita antarctica]
MKKLLPLLLFLFLSGLVFAQQVDIELYKSGFSDPLNLQHANDDRLFVVEQGGKIKIIQGDGTVNTTPFLDISGQISSGGERGLLGLAFHPDYTNNGYFYVNYSKPNGDTQISRFSVDSGNPDIADQNSELPIIDYSQPFSNHNGGCLAFGPDDYLYIASGDGGSSGDPGNRAQNINLLLGKLLRIDVDNPSGGNNYGIPAGNPFVGNPNAREEIWAYGLRNPWRFSFDLTENNLWIGDVGQSNLEEINRVSVAEAGLNYGWRCYEGTQPFNTQNCPPQSEITFPIAEYTHASGNCSITGGYVYRGSVYSDIAGLYFFADYCSGMIGTVDGSGNLIDHGNFSGNWVSFGEDVNKELYIVDKGGSIYKITGDPIIGTEDFSLEDTLSMLPNPASENVTFSLKNDILQAIQVFDVRGSLVSSEENIFSNEKTISISNLNPRIYFAKITSVKEQTIVKKLIVQ